MPRRSRGISRERFRFLSFPLSRDPKSRDSARARARARQYARDWFRVTERRQRRSLTPGERRWKSSSKSWRTARERCGEEGLSVSRLFVACERLVQVINLDATPRRARAGIRNGRYSSYIALFRRMTPGASVPETFAGRPRKPVRDGFKVTAGSETCF